MKIHETSKFFRLLLFAAAVILIFALFTNIRSVGAFIVKAIKVFSPLLIGILMALILYKPMMGIRRAFLFLKKKLKLNKILSDKLIDVFSLIITLLLAVLLLYFIGNSVIPQIMVSFKSIFSSIDEYYPTALNYLREMGIDTAEIERFITDLDLSRVWETLSSNAPTIFNTAFGAVNGLFAVITTVFSSVIFSIYCLSNRNTLKRQTNKLLFAYFRPEVASKIKNFGKLVMGTFLNFFAGQCVEAVILGTIFFIAMSIFGFPFATVISVLIAVTALVPYVGAFIGCAVGAVLISMQDPMKALLFIVMFLIIQQLENNLIYPRVVGTSVNLPAIWTFAAVVVGGALFGVVGMMLFIPLTSIIYALLRADVNSRAKRKIEELNIFYGNLSAESPEEESPMTDGATEGVSDNQ